MGTLQDTWTWNREAVFTTRMSLDVISGGRFRLLGDGEVKVTLILKEEKIVL